MDIEMLIEYRYMFLVLLIWELIWKGFALWKAARKNDKYWFTGMLVINTAGILPILYIFVFSRMVNGKLPVGKHDTKN